MPNDSSSLLSRRFPALTHRDFRLLWFGQIVSIAGSQMQNVAIFYQIDAITRSKTMLALVGLVRFVPIVVFALIGGVVADARNRRGIMFITQSLMMASAIGLGVVTLFSEQLDPWTHSWIILGLTGLTAAAGAFDNPARQALIPNLVPPEHLPNAVSLNTTMFQAAMIIGPAMAGVLIGQVGVKGVYWFNAATFLAVIAALLMMRVVERHGEERPQISIAAMLEGLKFVRRARVIYSTMLLDFFATFFSSATALLPVFAREVLHIGPEKLGILYAAEAVGSLLAGIVMSSLGDIRRKGWVLLWSVAAYGAATAIYGFSADYWLSLLMLGLVGVGDSISTVLRVSIRQLFTPDHIRGRMTSVNMIFFMGGPQLGNMEAGLLAAAVGAPMSVVIGGIATVLLVAFTAWRFPELRNYD
ncbi:MAG: MFS transporter [Armatimonadetes bacterium]|nr:MFS transporter [Armatimonadota bacterium]